MDNGIVFCRKLDNNRGMDIASLIEDILGATGWSESQLAKRVRVSRSTIRRMRTGETKEPRSYTVSKLLAVYFDSQHH